MVCKVLVVCGSPVVASADLLRRLAGECDHVIAVDRGLDALLGAGLSCDVYVGDADTVSDAGRALVDAATDFEVERHDPYKDYTDLALALDSVRRRWPGAEVVATCATGGRPDMALSVLGLLAGYDDAPVWIVEDETTARILHRGESWAIEGAEGKTFSIIAIAPGTAVSEHGLEWELDHSPLGLLADTGISNVVRVRPRSKSTPAPPSLTYINRHLESDQKKSLHAAPTSPIVSPRHGGVAQLGERLTGSQEVRGSIPLVSTIVIAKAFGIPKAFFHAKTSRAKTPPPSTKSCTIYFPCLYIVC